MPSHESELSIGASVGSIRFTPSGPGRPGDSTAHSCQPKPMVSAMSPAFHSE
jgi:hypothetical protein